MAPLLLRVRCMPLAVILLLLIFRVAVAAEPSLQQVQTEAVRSIGFHPEEMEGWRRRVRWAAALPRLQFGFSRDLKDVVKLSTRDSVSVTGGDVFIGPDESAFDQDFNQGTSFDVKAVWYLDELVFNRDSLAVSGEIRDWMREKSRILEAVSEAYSVRRRLLHDLQQGRGEPFEVREKRKLLLDQAIGTIDAYTGGWFSRQVEEGRDR